MYYLCSVDEREQSTLLNLKTHNTTDMENICPTKVTSVEYTVYYLTSRKTVYSKEELNEVIEEIKGYASLLRMELEVDVVETVKGLHTNLIEDEVKYTIKVG